MKLSKRLAIVFPQMSENKPRYEYESWLLPFKPIDSGETNDVFKKPDSHYFELNKVRKKEDEFIRDSKNRRILSRQALLEDTLVNPDHIPGPSNISSPSTIQPSRTIPASSSIPVSSSIPASSTVSASSTIPASSTTVSATIPGPSTILGPNLNPGLNSSFLPSLSPTPDTTPASRRKSRRERLQKPQHEAKNPLQRKLEKALAIPVTMSKAESMMLKMGWSGGALGKTGGGIIEPIVPNLVYATSTKGFGQAPPSPKIKPPKQLPMKSAKTKNKPDKSEKEKIRIEKRQQRLRLKTVFKENVMRYILDFINNEREIGLLFDKSLHNGQRKVIHCIVQEIRNLNECEVKSKIMNSSNDRMLLMNIASKNSYLCLFKEAPEYMYLVTHYKLNDKESDYVISDDKREPRFRIFRSKKQIKADRLEQNARRLREQQMLDDNCSIDKESKDKVVQQSFDTFNVRKISDDSIAEINCESDDKDSESEDETVDEFNENDNKITEVDFETNEEIKERIDFDKEINEIVERTAAGACKITKSDKVFEIDKNIPENRNESLVKENNEVKDKVEMTDEAKLKTDNEETAINISITSSSRKEFMRYNLNMCFSDFMSGSAYKKFKFLGEFDEEEFEVLNEFLRDFFLVKNDKPALDVEFMGVWNQANCKLSYKRDLNGGIVIYKAL